MPQLTPVSPDSRAYRPPRVASHVIETETSGDSSRTARAKVSLTPTMNDGTLAVDMRSTTWGPRERGAGCSGICAGWVPGTSLGFAQRQERADLGPKSGIPRSEVSLQEEALSGWGPVR
jgi:hypothetical protein